MFSACNLLVRKIAQCIQSHSEDLARAYTCSSKVNIRDIPEFTALATDSDGTQFHRPIKMN